MRFEQAFYIAGDNQASKYREGVVSASSNQEESFLEQCQKLGSRFSLEPEETKAEFVLYSDIFKNFIAVKLSVGRRELYRRSTMLCHFFIPAGKEALGDISECLMAYPFLTELEKGKKVEAQNLEPLAFHGQKILRKYGLQEEKKMAALLCAVYPCIFQEKLPLYMVLDPKQYAGTKLEEAAREIVWLLSHFLPHRKDDWLHYMKQLSFGVHTVNNTSQAALIFTGETEEGRNEFHFAKAQQGSVPEVYERMAGFAISSIQKEEPFTFADALFVCGQEAEPDYRKLPLFYLKWKLDHKEKVSSQEMGERLRSILYSAKSSEWHSMLVLNYLVQSDELLPEDLEKYSSIVMPMLQRYDQMLMEEKEDIIRAAIHLVQRMYQMNRTLYKKTMEQIQELPQGIKKPLFVQLYRKSSCCIHEEEKEIQTTDAFLDFWKKYGLLKEEKEFCRNMQENAVTLYEKAGREERGRIAAVMGQMSPEFWQKYIVIRIRRSSNISDYAKFLVSEYGKMEVRHIQLYCLHMLELVEKGEMMLTEPEKMAVKTAYERLLEEGGGEPINPIVAERYELLFHKWALQRAEERRRRLLKHARDIESVEKYFVFMEETKVLPKMKSIKELFASYEALREEYPVFESVVRDKSSQNLSGEAKNQWKYMQCFFRMTEYKVSEENLKEACRLFFEAKSYFGKEEEEIQRLYHNMQKVMRDLEQQYQKERKEVLHSYHSQNREHVQKLAAIYNQTAEKLGKERLLRYVTVRCKDYGKTGRNCI